jgi:hypothetical protein
MWFNSKKQRRRTRTPRRQTLGGLRRRHETLEQRMLLSIAPNADSFIAANATTISAATSPGIVASVSTATVTNASQGVVANVSTTEVSHLPSGNLANVSTESSISGNDVSASNAVSTLTNVGGGVSLVGQQLVTNVADGAGNVASVVQATSASMMNATPGVLTTVATTTSAGGDHLSPSNVVSMLNAGGANIVGQQIVTNVADGAGNVASVVQATSASMMNATPNVLATVATTTSLDSNDMATSNAVSMLDAGGATVVGQQVVAHVAGSTSNLTSAVQSSSTTATSALPGVLASYVATTSAGGDHVSTSNVFSMLAIGDGNVTEQQILTTQDDGAGNLTSLVQTSSATTTSALPGVLASYFTSTSVGGENLSTSDAVSTFTGGGWNLVDDHIVTGNIESLANVVQSSSQSVTQTTINLNGPSATGVDAVMAEEAAIAMFWAAA